jgi:transportin-1
MSTEILVYIKNSIFPFLGDTNRSLRNTVGTIITTIAKQKDGINTWPELIPTLLALLDNSEVNMVDGAFSTLDKICEDAAPELDNAVARPLNQVFPKMIAMFPHPAPLVRKYAVGCINNLLRLMPGAMDDNMESLLQGLSQLTGDSDDDVRRLVCAALVTLVDVRLEVLGAGLTGIMEFMLTATADPNPQVALTAAEFWSVFCESAEEALDMLRAFFPRLIPLLVQRLAYTNDLLAELGVNENGDAEDAHVPDSAQDIRPLFAKGNASG